MPCYPGVRTAGSHCQEPKFPGWGTKISQDMHEAKKKKKNDIIWVLPESNSIINAQVHIVNMRNGRNTKNKVRRQALQIALLVRQ